MGTVVSKMTTSASLLKIGVHLVGWMDDVAPVANDILSPLISRQTLSASPETSVPARDGATRS